jgi:hypothetical protein
MSESKCANKLFARLRPLSVAVAAALMVGVAVPEDSEAKLIFYKYTPIADTGALFFTVVGHTPSINNSGRVAWTGTLAGNHVEGMFTRLGTGGISTLADNGDHFYVTFGPPSMNAQDKVVFGSHQSSGGQRQVLLLGSGNSATPIITSDDHDKVSLFNSRMNDLGTVVFGARDHIGRNAIFRRKSNGSLAPLMFTGGFLTSIDRTPSINNPGTTVFTATTLDGQRGIFKIAEGGSLNAVINDAGPFAGFSFTDVNDSEQVAFIGTLDDGVKGVFRFNPSTNSTISSTTRIVDTTGPYSGSFGGFSINNKGVVAYQGTLDTQAMQIATGPNSLFAGRIVGTGDALFGRTVSQVFMGPEGLNDVGQLVVKIGFSNNTSMIARLDPFLSPIFDNVLQVNALQLSTVSGADEPPSEGTVIATKNFATLQESIALSFDARFLAPGADLTVSLNGKPVQVIASGNIGARTAVKLKIDLRAYSNGSGNYDLGLEFGGRSGSTVQIEKVVVRDGLATHEEKEGLPDWKLIEKGGSAVVADATRFPIPIDVAPGKTTVVAGRPIPVAIISTTEVDASEIDTSSVRFVGTAVANEKSPAAARCSKSDVNGDRVADLYCEVIGPSLTATRGELKFTLEAETTSGLPVMGSDTVATLSR